MARGRGHGKSSGRSNPTIHVSMPTIPMPTVVSPQQGGSPTIGTSAQSISHTISETPPATPNQSNLIGQGLSTQSNATDHTNTVVEGDSSSSRTRTLVFLSSAGLEPSKACSNFISKSFKSDVDPNGINWKGVSNDVRNGYFGEFKAAVKYRNFISKIKGEGIRPDFVPKQVWERWMQLWGSDECIKKSKINTKIVVVAVKMLLGLTRAALSQLENIARNLLLKKGEIQHQVSYICTFTHMVIMKNLLLVSFLELSMKNMKKYYGKKQCLKSILINVKHITKLRGEKKRRIYGLGSEAKKYYGQDLCVSSSVPPSFSQSTPTTNIDEFVKQMMSALTNHLVPVILERVQAVITPISNTSILTPIVPPATSNVDEVDPLVSSDDRIP